MGLGQVSKDQEEHQQSPVANKEQMFATLKKPQKVTLGYGHVLEATGEGMYK